MSFILLLHFNCELLFDCIINVWIEIKVFEMNSYLRKTKLRKRRSISLPEVVIVITKKQ